MDASTTTKSYDLAQRTYNFAKNVRIFLSQLPVNQVNRGDIDQLSRSSGSVGANYLEASESFSKKDFVMRLKISRKESKETEYWLNLINPVPAQLEPIRKQLIDEVTQLRKIFGAIITKSQNSI